MTLDVYLAELVATCTYTRVSRTWVILAGHLGVYSFNLPEAKTKDHVCLLIERRQLVCTFHDIIKLMVQIEIDYSKQCSIGRGARHS